MAFDPYSELPAIKVDLLPQLNFHFKEIFCTIKRRLKIRQTINHPYKIIINHKLHHELYLKWYRAVRDYVPSFGRKITVSRKRNRSIKSIEISFTHLGSFRYHLTKAVGEDVKTYLKKSIGDCKLKVVVSEDKPAVLCFDMNRNSLSMKLSYEVTNRYGIIASY